MANFSHHYPRRIGRWRRRATGAVGSGWLSAAFAVALSLIGSGAFAQLSDADRKCLDAVYKGSRKVAEQEFRGNARDCIRDRTGDQSACINVDRPKSIEQATTLVTKYETKCDPLPAFGVHPDVGVIIDAAQGAADAVIRNKWGAPVDPDGSRCHYDIAKTAGKLAAEQWKEFRRCAKALATVASIADIEGCIATGIAAGSADEGPDVIDDVTGGSCAGPIPHFEDGDCSGLPLVAAAQCIIHNVECEVCLALNAITGAAAPCATISGIACNFPPPKPTATSTHTAVPSGTPTNTRVATPGPPHKCTFDETTDNSDLDILLDRNTSIGGLIEDISGAIDISCDPSSQDANGKRRCTCALQTWTPPIVTGLGYICATPLAGCPEGEMDCDGGNPLGIDALDDHQIGACTSHGGCASQCDTYCAGINKVQWGSGCENLCHGGSRDNQACVCDTAGTGGCVGGIAGVNDCPNGTCVGKNNEADQDCRCQCIDYAAGGPSSAGDVRCNLGMGFRIYPTLPCPPGSVYIYINQPPVCIPLSSQSATGETISVNEDESPSEFIGPHTLVGTPETCASFDTSTTTGLQLVANLGVFETTLGDARAHLTLDCQ